ncbi:MAG: nucleotidyltransferase domain-containing protein [Chitinophagaceae bacterium]|nr:nucleotidyltransferase domain-containing protein [Chitinophagaceae bacterium]
MTIENIKRHGLLLLEVINGSRAFGLHKEDSDTDIRGVFYLPKRKFYGLGYIPQVSNASNDIVYYELGRFIELLIKNNPGMLEILATPDDCILYRHPVMDSLPLSLFLSKLCKDSFGGYAYTQVKKARGYNKKMMNPVAKERKSVTDFCYVIKGQYSKPLNEWLAENQLRSSLCGLVSVPHANGMYALYYDATGTKGYRGIASGELANEVCLSSVAEAQEPLIHLYFNRDGYSAYCKTYAEYWEWIEKRNEERWLMNDHHGKGYDAKNMMHTIRLLQEAQEILRDGVLQPRRNNRDELLAIKAGAYEYEELLDMSSRLMEQIELEWLNSKLPETPDSKRIEAILVTIRNELYSSW